MLSGMHAMIIDKEAENRARCHGLLQRAQGTMTPGARQSWSKESLCFWQTTTDHDSSPPEGSRAPGGPCPLPEGTARDSAST